MCGCMTKIIPEQLKCEYFSSSVESSVVTLVVITLVVVLDRGARLVVIGAVLLLGRLSTASD